jgi:hypothetical protein
MNEHDMSRTAADRDTERRTTIAIGLLLVAVGAAFLVGRLLDVRWADVGWPLFVIGAGIVLFVLALAVGGSGGTGFSVPAGIVTMVGVVLAVQNATGLWATWAYAWALVAPGGVGVGLLLYGLLSRQPELIRAGGWSLVTGLGLFLGFAFFFEVVIGLSGNRISGIDTLLSGGLIVLGVVILGASLFGRSPSRDTSRDT